MTVPPPPQGSGSRDADRFAMQKAARNIRITPCRLLSLPDHVPRRDRRRLGRLPRGLRKQLRRRKETRGAGGEAGGPA